MSIWIQKETFPTCELSMSMAKYRVFNFLPRSDPSFPCGHLSILFRTDFPISYRYILYRPNVTNRFGHSDMHTKLYRSDVSNRCAFLNICFIITNQSSILYISKQLNYMQFYAYQMFHIIQNWFAHMNKCNKASATVYAASARIAENTKLVTNTSTHDTDCWP